MPERDAYLMHYEDAGSKMHLLQQAIAKAEEAGKEFLTGTVNGIPLPRYDRHHLSLGASYGYGEIVRAHVSNEIVTAWCQYHLDTNYVVSIFPDGETWASESMILDDFFPPVFQQKKGYPGFSGIWLRKSSPPIKRSLDKEEKPKFKWELVLDDEVVAECGADQAYQNIMLPIATLKDTQQRETALRYITNIASFEDAQWIKKESPDTDLHVPDGCLRLRKSFLWLCRL